jgi:proteasome accessory factor B
MPSPKRPVKGPANRPAKGSPKQAARGSAKRPAKVQRWIDVITALLRRHYAIDFKELAKEVPAYSKPGKENDALMQMFERDKAELRILGVPIETLDGEDGSQSTYRLTSRSFYLPLLQVSRKGAPLRPPHRPSGVGYSAIPVLAFEPDELVMIARAAARVQQMQHQLLADHAATAVRKLAFDVAVGDGGIREVMLNPFQPQDSAVLDALDHAVRRRKRVAFNYRSMERNVQARRYVEPYGLVFLSGLWYLVALDVEADALRHFRVSRISDPVANTAKPQSTDFATPTGFDLWSHAGSKRAWELGDGDAKTVLVRFDRSTAYAVAGAELGESDPDNPDCRRFVVRRPDAFVRWLLSFGGAARPVSPKPIVRALRELARQTANLYEAKS